MKILVLVALLLLLLASAQSHSDLFNQPKEFDPGAEQLRKLLLDASTREQANVNGIFDSIILAIRTMAADSGKSQIEIPDFKDENIEGWNGWFQDLTTITRTGDASIEYGNGNVTFNARLGLQRLRVGYDIRVWYSIISKKGKIDVKVGTNSVEVGVGLWITPSSGCTVGISNLRMDQLSNFDVSVSGFIVNPIINYILEKKLNSETMKDDINTALKEIVPKFTVPCTSLLPKPNNTISLSLSPIADKRN